MPYYKYSAADETGKEIHGFIEAENKGEVALKLQEIGYHPTEIHLSRAPRKFNIKSLLFKRGISLGKLITFTRQFSSMLKAGISMLQGLQLLSRESEDPKLRKALTEVVLDIESGKSLSESLERFPYLFPNVYMTTVRAGEISGTLPSLLDELASYMEFDLTTMRNIKAAIRYPVLVIVSLVMAFVVLITFVVPKFTALFEQLRAELPLPTRIMLAINTLFSRYWFGSLITIIFIIVGVRIFTLTELGHYVCDRIILKIPIIGKIVLKANISRFSRLLATLYKAGIPILNAFAIIRQTMNNRVLLREVEIMSESVQRGSGIASSLAGSRFFPPMAASMISVGEKSGSLDTMLEEISNHYDAEVTYSVRNLNTMIEPILLLFLAFGVAFLALAIFLPIWRLYKAI